MYFTIRSMAQHKARWVIAVVVISLMISAMALGQIAPTRAASSPSGTVDVATAKAWLAELPLAFVPNVGQSAPDVAFEVRNAGANLYFMNQRVVIALAAPEQEADTLAALQTLALEFDGASADAAVSGLYQYPGVVNYYQGDDETQWQTNVPTYQGILYTDLYPGVDLYYDGSDGVLKGTYTVAAAVDPGVIRWRFDGAADVELDAANGDLLVALADGSLAFTERAPVAWQTINGQQVDVPVQYALDEAGFVSFDLGDYDPAYPLVIDPTLQFSIYLGGVLVDQAEDIQVDAVGNIYITGRTDSIYFPTYNALSSVHGGSADAFVMKLNVSKPGLFIYSTFLGGLNYDQAYGLALDASGNAYVTGETISTNFPTAAPPGKTPFQTSRNGTDIDGFVSKFDGNGSLVYSTYVGGEGADFPFSIAVDVLGYAYITGQTNSVEYPRQLALYYSYRGGLWDAFVTKLLPDGSGLQYSTYLGGNGVDVGADIVVDSGGQAVVVGRTASANYPTSASAFQTVHDPTLDGEGKLVDDAFVSKMTLMGNGFVFSTFLGGNGLDQAYGVAVDATNNIYVTGLTGSTNFYTNNPLTSPISGAMKQGGEDAFVTKFDPFGNTPSYSTYFGGSGDDQANSIALDPSNNMYIVGSTNSSNLPQVAGFDSDNTFNGTVDAFVTEILADGLSLEYSSYLGGGNEDNGVGIAVDEYGSTFVTGDTNSINFPLAGSTSYQFGGEVDAFVARIGSLATDLAIGKTDSPDTVSVGDTLTYTITVRVVSSPSNPDPDMATDVVMSDPLPSQLEYVSAVGSAGDCSYDVGTHTVNCTIDQLALGDPPVVFTLTTTVLQSGNIYNVATVSSSQFDSSGGNNTAEQVTSSTTSADLEVTKTASAGKVESDQEVTYTLTVENLGFSIANNIVISDVLPTGVTYVSSTASQGSYAPATGYWSVGALGYGSTATLDIVVLVDTGLSPGEIITNEASVFSSSQQDPDPSNNASSINIVIASPYPDSGCYPSSSNPSEVICLMG